MENATRISKILAKINWTKIQDYHMKLNILWDIENKNGAVETRVPGEADIKNELESLLLYMFDNGLDYISYGNWVIFWENDDSDYEVRVIFRLDDYMFSNKVKSHIPFEKGDTIEDLQVQLDCAIEDEDYELCAKLRDKIQALDKKD